MTADFKGRLKKVHICLVIRCVYALGSDLSCLYFTVSTAEEMALGHSEGKRTLSYVLFLGAVTDRELMKSHMLALLLPLQAPETPPQGT